MKKLIVSFSEKFFNQNKSCLDIACELTALRRRLENRYPNTVIKIQAVDSQSRKYLTYSSKKKVNKNQQ